MKNIPFVASWNGGKDSALAYYLALKLGMVPKKVLTMFEDEMDISKSHALPFNVVQAQVNRLGVSLFIKHTSWSTYEEQFTDAINTCRAEGITHGVFGDTDLVKYSFKISPNIFLFGLTILIRWMRRCVGLFPLRSFS